MEQLVVLEFPVILSQHFRECDGDSRASLRSMNPLPFFMHSLQFLRAVKHVAKAAAFRKAKTMRAPSVL